MIRAARGCPDPPPATRRRRHRGSRRSPCPRPWRTPVCRKRSARDWDTASRRHRRPPASDSAPPDPGTDRRTERGRPGRARRPGRPGAGGTFRPHGGGARGGLRRGPHTERSGWRPPPSAWPRSRFHSPCWARAGRSSGSPRGPQAQDRASSFPDRPAAGCAPHAGSRRPGSDRSRRPGSAARPRRAT
jgi:hypothetical protein